VRDGKYDAENGLPSGPMTRAADTTEVELHERSVAAVRAQRAAECAAYKSLLSPVRRIGIGHGETSSKHGNVQLR
jgi:hypothetical protein